ASVWGILEAVIAGLERSSLVPWEKLDSRKVFLEATARIPEYTRCQMTREQGEEARHPMYGAILGPSFGKTAGAFVENGERMDFERTFSGMNDGAQVVFRAGDFSLSVNLMSLKASLGPKAVHLMESFFLLLKHRDMVFAIYQGAVKACGLSNLSFFLKEETLHLKASCPSSFLEKKQKGKEPVAEEAFPLGSAYKRRLSSFLARYKACTIQDKEKGRELPGYGQVLPTVFLYEVARNAKYCTRAAIIKYLRGLTLDESVLENFGHSPYQGAFGLVSTARWEEVCSWLLQQKLIREETVEGNYGSFAILKPENLARYFLYGQEDYYHKKKAEYTEIEMADYIARETLAGKKTSAHIERAQYLAEHPGVYCLAKEGADAYLAGAPEQVGAYLKTLYKLEEDRAMKKYLKELCNACS
ncbi:MAG: hypothetical protein IIZ39_09500, partial [Blautia sp.]|nr:hypothetical protein [Blautia sp.]